MFSQPKHNNPEMEDSQALEGKLSSLTTAVEKFAPVIDHGDRDWEFYLKHKRTWIKLCVKNYDGSWYVNIFTPSISNGAKMFSFSLDNKNKEEKLSPPSRETLSLLPVITSALHTIAEEVKSDPIVYHSTLLKQIPPTMRYGVIPSSFVQQIIPEWRNFRGELSRFEIDQALAICERGSLEPMLEMTAGKFFEYCKIAYHANPATFTAWKGEGLDPTADGRELYKRWADGRDGGLSELELDSPEAFRAWYEEGRSSGGHPWEIYRGGNSTHIDLGVLGSSTSEGKQWEIYLSAFSSTRLIECCRIANALYRAGLPFKFIHDESYRLRLRSEDLVGIIPEWGDMGYGWHNFPKEFKVADCIKFSIFSDERSGKQLRRWREIQGVVDWLPIKPLRISGDS